MEKLERSLVKRMSVMTVIAFICFSGCTPNPQAEKDNNSDKNSQVIANAGESNNLAAANDSVGLVANDPDAAPEIKLEYVFQGPDADKVNLKELRGNVVVLDYWATW